jgi:hypothetical protein
MRGALTTREVYNKTADECRDTGRKGGTLGLSAYPAFHCPALPRSVSTALAAEHNRRTSIKALPESEDPGERQIGPS